jgi:hypothetical protein
MVKYKKYSCKYIAEWPVDQFGRLGGMYSSSGLPITGYVENERDGMLLSIDSRTKTYEVQDGERQFVKRIVPFDKVSNITELAEVSNKLDKYVDSP